MDTILEILRNIDPVLVYFGLFAGAYVENLLPPLPGDTIVVFGAYLVGIGTLRIDLALVSTTIGSLLGFMTYFVVGRLYGNKILAEGRSRIVSIEKYRLVEQWFEKYGYGIIAANRFLAGARSIISFVAGAVRLDPLKVTVYAFISCTVWNSALIFSGYKLGENWEQVIVSIKKYNIAVFTLLVLFLVIFILRKLYLRKTT